MSHFAQVIDGIVQDVIVAGQDFIDALPNPQNWVQTSYNTRGNVHYAPISDIPDGEPPLRGNYAGIGYTYDAINDVFYTPQPYPSWTLNTNTWLWEAPIKMPTKKGNWTWDEPTLSWILGNTLTTK
jgi:hypothetical protein